MNIVAELRARLRARSDAEHEQAILRIAIGSLVLAVLLGRTYIPLGSGDRDADLAFVFALATYLLIALALFVGICIWPAPSILRRVISMIADIGTTTFCLFWAGEAGGLLLAIYLFITFGYGIRYGRPYLWACQGLCVLGFLAVLLYAPYWRVHTVTGWTWMMALVVLPLYVSTLVKRLQQRHAATERALKDCLERERRTG